MKVYKSKENMDSEEVLVTYFNLIEFYVLQCCASKYIILDLRKQENSEIRNHRGSNRDSTAIYFTKKQFGIYLKEK